MADQDQPPPPFYPGQDVIWLREGWDFRLVPVAAQVVRVTRTRIHIAVILRSGERVDHRVKPETLRPRDPAAQPQAQAQGQEPAS